MSAVAPITPLTLVTPRALAQSADTPQSEPQGYREIVRQGTQEFELGNYAEARSLFERAHELHPNARTSRALGLAEFELRNYLAAIAHFKAALSSQVKPLSPEARASTESLLQRADAFLGRVRLVVEPESAAALLDGQELGDTPEELVLSVGDHIFEFRASGYATQRKSVRIVGGESQTLRISLTQLDTGATSRDSTSASSSTSQEREPHRAPVYKKWWLWTTIAVVAAGGAVAGALLLTRDEKQREVATRGPSTPPGARVLTASVEIGR